MQNKLQNIILAASILFFVLATLSFLFLYRMVGKKHQAVEEAQVAWQTEALRRQDIKTLDRNLADVAEERAELEEHFSKSSDVVPLLDSVERLAVAASAKAEISSVDPLDGGKSLLIGIQSSGSWSAIYKFVTLLENSPYELEIILFDIRKSQSEAGGWEGTFRVKVLSFLP